MQSIGTKLVIRQMNISRSVTDEQYEAVLRAFVARSQPGIQPNDSSSRARRGVEGLLKDVWPSLLWGSANAPVLFSRMEQLQNLDVASKARHMAEAALGRPIHQQVTCLGVMGGRAGAAAFENVIYFDILANSYRDATGSVPYPSQSEIVEYFAHEMHHIGLGEIHDALRRKLRLSTEEARRFDKLAGIVAEGSASLLINGHGRLANLQNNPLFRQDLAKVDSLIALLPAIIADSSANYAGMEAHAVGATLLDRIRRLRGAAAMKKAIEDPRQLARQFRP